MAVTDFSAAFGVSPKVAATLITALEKRGAYVLADADDSRTVTMGNCLYLIFNGRLFHYDATDATTAHDGVTCCVSFEGKRYKADAFGGGLLRIFSIQSKTLTAPPVSPTIGQQWIVAVGGTGLWAGKDNYIASWTARGWVFTVPSTYDLAMNAADTKYYNFAVSNTWVAGLPAVVLGPSTISPAALKYGRFGLPIVNQTTNTPPGSPADGDAYVIGGTPTGAWAGNARNIAIYETTAWVIYPQYNGAAVYDVSINANIVSSGTAWASAISGYSKVSISTFLASNVNITGTYLYALATAPTTSNTNSIHSLSYTPKKSGVKLKITAQIGGLYLQAGSASGAVASLGIFIDAAANAADWVAAGITFSFNFTGPQNVNAVMTYQTTGTTAITITLRGSVNKIGGAGSGTPAASAERIYIIIEELAS